MAEDNPFRDNNSNFDWEQFNDDIDYDCVFADAATKGKGSDTKPGNHTMSIQEIADSNGIPLTNTQTPSTPSSVYPTPPPLPIIDDFGIDHEQLNDNFWNEIIDSATPLRTKKTPKKSPPHRIRIKSPLKPLKIPQSVVEQAKYPITPVTNRNSSVSQRRSRTNSLHNPCNLEFGIELNTPSAPKKKKKSRKKRRSKSSRKNSESITFSSCTVETYSEQSKQGEYAYNTDIRLDKLTETMEDNRSNSIKTDDTQSKYDIKYCQNQARRRSSYHIGFKQLDFDPMTFNVMKACNEQPINVFEIGKIIDVLRGKTHSWELQKYLSDYTTNGITSPIFEISHATKGKHLVIGCYPRCKDTTQFLRNHPIIPIMDSFGIDTIYTPVKYSKKSGFNYKLQTVMTSIGNGIKVDNLDVLDEEYRIINKEFYRQCEKLFDKILYGKGMWKWIPGVDSVFITHWNTFMRKYRNGVEECYLNGDLKGYLLLVAMFWAVVLRFKKKNRCKNLSKVLSSRMGYRIVRNLEQRLNDKHVSVTLVSLNLLFRPNGIFGLLKENGWDIQPMDEQMILDYRIIKGFDPSFKDVNVSVRKTAKHAAKVMSWSRNSESCIVM